jgi:hypothetical protein
LAFARVSQGPVPWLERNRTPGGELVVPMRRRQLGGG